MTNEPRPTRRQIVRRVLFVGFVVLSLSLVVLGYRGTSPVFAWQMFPESSTWQADIVRVTGAGERIDVRDEWPGGYRWEGMVTSRGLSSPWTEGHASYGAAATLDNLQKALDWVASNTPDDEETAYLEAAVTYRHNGGPAQTVVLHSTPRDSL